jgi:hypothetical protein
LDKSLKALHTVHPAIHMDQLTLNSVSRMSLYPAGVVVGGAVCAERERTGAESARCMLSPGLATAVRTHRSSPRALAAHIVNPIDVNKFWWTGAPISISCRMPTIVPAVDPSLLIESLLFSTKINNEVRSICVLIIAWRPSALPLPASSPSCVLPLVL